MCVEPYESRTCASNVGAKQQTTGTLVAVETVRNQPSTVVWSVRLERVTRPSDGSYTRREAREVKRGGIKKQRIRRFAYGRISNGSETRPSSGGKTVCFPPRNSATQINKKNPRTVVWPRSSVRGGVKTKRGSGISGTCEKRDNRRRSERGQKSCVISGRAGRVRTVSLYKYITYIYTGLRVLYMCVCVRGG